MPTSTNLALLLSLAACEHADSVATQKPLDPKQPPEPELQVQESAAPARPAIGPVAQPTPPTVAPAATPNQKLTEQKLTIDAKPFDSKLLEKRCMSRAGCKWDRERETPRVVKKAPATP